MFFFLLISDHPVLGYELVFIIDAEDALDALLELLDAGFRIRIDLMRIRIRIQHFF
jgi:hypothetical protein